MRNIQAAITAVHGTVPEKILSNSDLEKMVDTNDEWIVTRTGIKERRIVSNGVTLSDLGADVVKEICKTTFLPFYIKYFSLKSLKN